MRQISCKNRVFSSAVAVERRPSAAALGEGCAEATAGGKGATACSPASGSVTDAEIEGAGEGCAAATSGAGGLHPRAAAAIAPMRTQLPRDERLFIITRCYAIIGRCCRR